MLRSKRLFDIVFSLIGIIVLSPVMIIIAIAVEISVPGSVLFRQEREGKDRQIFYILKFRTMGSARNTSGTMDDDSGSHKVAGAGHFLRRTKLDELPQLFNILRGDMSFVGPRPYVVDESLDLPDERFAMRPGLTGLAQVYGNTCLSWEERTAYDIEYIRNYSIGLDVMIMLRTVKVVVKGEGACVRHIGE